MGRKARWWKREGAGGMWSGCRVAWPVVLDCAQRADARVMPPMLAAAHFNPSGLKSATPAWPVPFSVVARQPVITPAAGHVTTLEDRSMAALALGAYTVSIVGPEWAPPG